MNTVIAIYQWVGLAFVLFGFAYGVYGLFRGDCPFLGFGKFSDSMVNRFATGVGIAMIWPVFIPLVILDSLFGNKRRPRL